MTEIQLNMYHALALGAAMYALGLVLTKKIPVLSRFCIPAPSGRRSVLCGLQHHSLRNWHGGHHL